MKKVASNHSPLNSHAHLPALTGIRFFAIYYIFMHHLWAVFTYYSGTSEDTQGLLASLNKAPEWLLVFFSNGWIATSFFFVLSGFILGYLYWGKSPQMNISKRHFWLQRFSRIYPIHLLVLSVLIYLKIDTYFAEERGIETIVGSAIATAFLLQAWIPSYVPMWSWPTWTISVIVFLYFLFPFIIKVLSTLSNKQQYIALFCVPCVSIIPAVAYTINMSDVDGWQMHVEIFYSNFPLFWVPYFIAGMLCSRLFMASTKPIGQRFSISIGDLALVALVVIACIPNISSSLIYFMRYALLLPLYLVIIVDLAHGRGIFARLLSGRVSGFLGELGFSIFVWQAVVLALAFSTVKYYPAIGDYQVLIACIGIVALAAFSTYVVEKPFAQFIRRRFK